MHTRGVDYDDIVLTVLYAKGGGWIGLAKSNDLQKMFTQSANLKISGIKSGSMKILKYLTKELPRCPYLPYPWLESLQIARPRFRKFTIKYIGNIKTAQPRSWLHNTNYPEWALSKQNQQNRHSVGFLLDFNSLLGLYYWLKPYLLTIL